MTTTVESAVGVQRRTTSTAHFPRKAAVSAPYESQSGGPGRASKVTKAKQGCPRPVESSRCEGSAQHVRSTEELCTV